MAIDLCGIGLNLVHEVDLVFSAEEELLQLLVYERVGICSMNALVER